MVRLGGRDGDLPTIPIRVLPLLGRPFEERTHDALPLPSEEPTRRVALRRILHVKRERVAMPGSAVTSFGAPSEAMRTSTVMNPSFRRFPGIQAVETYSPARLGSCQRGLVSMALNDDVSSLIDHLDLREHRRSIAAEHARTRSRFRLVAGRRPPRPRAVLNDARMAERHEVVPRRALQGPATPDLELEPCPACRYRATTSCARAVFTMLAAVDPDALGRRAARSPACCARRRGPSSPTGRGPPFDRGIASETPRLRRRAPRRRG